jgi:hypothetical protein
MVEEDGNVISINNIKELDIEDGYKVFKEETKTAQHAGCIDGRTKKRRASCKIKNELPRLGEKCCVDLNKKSVGIEVVNLGYNCGGRSSCKNAEGVEISEEDWEKYVGDRYNDESIEGLIWEEFTNKQINALVDLVTGIVIRNNIPIDRQHIVGHDESAQGYKWDPGPAFPWEEFMVKVKEKAQVSSSIGKNFYVLDRAGNQYVIQILTIVGKTEKNVA